MSNKKRFLDSIDLCTIDCLIIFFSFVTSRTMTKQCPWYGENDKNCLFILIICEFCPLSDRIGISNFARPIMCLDANPDFIVGALKQSLVTYILVLILLECL